MSDYFLGGAEAGILLGFVFYIASWALTIGLRLLKINRF